MGKFNYDSITKYSVVAKTISPLHIGSSLGDKEDILVNAEGKPFIQASTIAGMLRSSSEILNGNDLTEYFFGSSRVEEGSNSNDYRSRVRVTDGEVDYSTVKLELRPHVAVDRKTGSVKGQNGAGHKFDMTYLSAGAQFSFDVYLYLEKAQSDNQVKFENILGVLVGEDAIIGAKKSSGAGKIKAERIEKNEYDMTRETDRAAWIADMTCNPTDITPTLKGSSLSCKYKVSVKAKTIGAIQIKGIAMSEFGGDAPDSENIKNGNGDYIIPGSSIRGAFRDQMERIASYLEKPSIIDSAFGVVAKNHSESHAGILVFNDCVIGEAEDNDMNGNRNRIHIDKFTGGVMDKALFREKNAAGELKDFSIQIYDGEKADAVLGLVILALRDLATNVFNLGNGYAIGKGFLTVEEIRIIGARSEATITYGDGDGNMKDDNNLIDNSLKALKEV